MCSWASRVMAGSCEICGDSQKDFLHVSEIQTTTSSECVENTGSDGKLSMNLGSGALSSDHSHWYPLLQTAFLSLP